jgi:hypothetical protein
VDNHACPGEALAHCPPTEEHDGVSTEFIQTQDYALLVGSATGSRGDVVGITLTLESHLLNLTEFLRLS